MIKKYLISFENSWNFETRQLKTGATAKEQYLRVVEIIESEFKDLTSNPYYLDLLYKYPDLTMLQVYISREIAESRISTEFKLNKGTLSKALDLYAIVKADLPKKNFRKGGRFSDLNESVEKWKQILNI